MVIFVFVVNFLFLASKSFGTTIPASCPDIGFNKIPPSHLFHKKEKPVIIAHRGQPKVFQENTKEGILSTLDIKADGFELDIYKTKDDKLVVFHDDNTERMTGVSKIVYNSTYAELLELNITTSVIAGNVTYKYDKSRKIPLLEDVLKETKTHDILHYLEMKPSNPFNSPEELATKTGELVAKMIQDMNILQKTILVSFDFRKTASAKKTNPNITVGTLFTQKFSKVPKAVYEKVNTFTNLSKCLKDASNNTFDFFQFILNDGMVFKASGSSSFDCDIALYNNALYSNDTLTVFRKNYGKDVSTGFYTVYSMSKTEAQNKADEKKLKELKANGGGQRMITDDVPRLRKLLGYDDDTSHGSLLTNKLLFTLTAFLIVLIKNI